MATPTDAQGDTPKTDAAIPVRKREIFGWAMYDFANSSYTTVVITVVYSAFFVGTVVPAESTVKDSYWTAAMVSATLVALLLSPLVGALCDYSGGKKRYLAISTAICALGTAALFFVGPGDIALALILLTISNAAFMIGESFCGSFLTDLATKKNMGLISGLGWGLGYFGGLASLIGTMALISAKPEEHPEQLGDFIAQNQMAMVFIGAFFVVAALPTFLLVRERSKPQPGFERVGVIKLLRTGLKELADSYKLVKEHKALFQFFIAFMVYMAGLEIVVKFVGIYAKEEIGLTSGELIVVFLIIQISAALGALAFGFLESRVGAKVTVLGTIAWWAVGCLAIFFLPQIAAATGFKSAQVFFVIALIAGGGIGSIQSSSRAVVGLLAPAGRSAQMFGFWGTFSRLSIILGLLVFGPLSDTFGRRYAILSVLAFFVIGGLLLWFVPIEDLEKGHDADSGPETPQHA